jgi:hypothetical protein
VDSSLKHLFYNFKRWRDTAHIARRPLLEFLLFSKQGYLTLDFLPPFVYSIYLYKIKMNEKGGKRKKKKRVEQASVLGTKISFDY